MDDFPRLLSRPVRVRWAGWESDTHRLQQAGWQLAAEQHFDSMTMSLAVRHQDYRCIGVSQRIPWRYYENARGFPPTHHDGLPLVDIQRMANNYEVRHEVSQMPFVGYRAIDAQPQLTQLKISRLEDLIHFAPAMVRSQQIIIPEQTVPELMERILKLQQPARERHFRDAAKGDRLDAGPRQKFHAQIISLAEAA